MDGQMDNMASTCFCKCFQEHKNLTVKFDLDIGPILTNVLNGEQLCQIILKSILNCRSYDPNSDEHTH